jgi:tetratricopeptide (TPR) repeat protein
MLYTNQLIQSLLTMQIGPDQIEALYQYAKFQFECGNYSGAADYLYQYRALCTNSERSVSALWGKLAAEILMQNWDVALEELNRLKEIIDSKVFLLTLYTLFFVVYLHYITNLFCSCFFLAELLITSESAPEQDMADALGSLHLLQP